MERDPTLLIDLEQELEPKGDPMSLVQWMSKSLAHLVEALLGQRVHDSQIGIGRDFVNVGIDHDTKEGLEVTAANDANTYPTGLKVTDEELAALHIVRASFHGEWNYTIKPQER